MKYRLLGRTGLFVYEICLSELTYGGKGRWAPIGKLGLSNVEWQLGRHSARTCIQCTANFFIVSPR